MKPQYAIEIDYWTLQKDETSLIQLKGQNDFIQSLDKEYILIFKGRPGGLGGGIHEFFVNIISNIKISDLSVEFVKDSIISGTQGLVVMGLAGLLKHYKKLKKDNKDYNTLSISNLNIRFKDTKICLYDIRNDTLMENLPNILLSVVKNYEFLKLKTGEYPYEIHIPLLKDSKSKSGYKYRTIEDMEVVSSKIKEDSYYKFWGCSYDLAGDDHIYEVSKKQLTVERFKISNSHK